MDVPSMVQRSGDTLIVRSVVSGNQLFLNQEQGAGSHQVDLEQQLERLRAQQLNAVIQNQSHDLNENQVSEASKDEGLPQCKIKRNYSCNYCTYFTQNPRYHLTHLRDVHGEKIVINKCKLCLYASRHYQKLVRHMKMVHGSTEGIDDNGQTRKRQVGRDARKRKIESSLEISPPPALVQLQHLQQQQQQQVHHQSPSPVQQSPPTFHMHIPTPPAKVDSPVPMEDTTTHNRLIKCSVCDFTTLYRAQLVEHEQDEHCKTKFFRCEKCSYVTHIKARFSKHVKYHSMPMIKCVTCDFRTPYKWNLDRHMKNHGGSGPFQCVACDFTADIKQSLTVHEMNHHVPPVGHAAGMNLARRRNKVGGTDLSEDFLSDTGEEDPFNNNNNIDDFDESYAKKCKYEEEDDDQPKDLSVATGGQQKKLKRTIPELIPIRNLTKDLAASRNALKGIASLFFTDGEIPEMLQRLDKSDAAQLSPSSNHSSASKRKVGNFFDKLKESFADDSARNENLVCGCGHISKCFSESIIHRKSCNYHSDDDKHSSPSPINLSMNNIGSTRCQHCRHRCKSSADLANHLKNCSENGHSHNDSYDSMSGGSSGGRHDYDEEMEEMMKHPMENRVFVWNKMPGMNGGGNGATGGSVNMNGSQSGEEGKKSVDVKSEENSYYGVETAPGYGEMTPEEEAANSSLKKVYKCPHCSFWASTASRFHVHIVGHLNKKPFECSLCAYRSNWRWDITKHIRLKTIRDPSHKNARVLMNDETGRRNYTKYNKYITLMKVTEEDGDPKLMKSGEMTPNQEASLAFLNDYNSKRDAINDASQQHDQESLASNEGNAFLRMPFFPPGLMNVNQESGQDHHSDAKRSPPPLIKPSDDLITDIKADGNEKKTFYKCRKCNYKHANRDAVLVHVREHYQDGYVAPSTKSSMNSPLSVSVNPNLYMNNVFAAMCLSQNPQLSLSVASGEKLSKSHSMLSNGLLQQAMSPTSAQSKLISNLVAAAAANSANTTKAHGETDEASSVVVVGGATTPTTTVTTTPPPPTSAPANCNLTSSTGASSASGGMVATTSSANYMSGAGGIGTTGTIASGATTPVMGQLTTGGTSNCNNNENEWRGPAPYRCGHCRQVSNWKHVIQRHCRLKHAGDINIEAVDRSSDRYAPVYRSLVNGGQQHTTTQSAQPQAQQQHGAGKSQTANRNDNNVLTNNNKNQLNPDNFKPKDQEPSSEHEMGGNSKSKHQQCPSCPYISESKSQMNYHISLHKANQYECNLCGYICSKKQQLAQHLKSCHEEETTAGPSKNPLGLLADAAIDLRSKASSDEESSFRLISFCPKCPSRFLNAPDLQKHLQQHGAQLSCRCEACDFSARQEPNMLAHSFVHTRQYQEKTEQLAKKFKEDPEYPDPKSRRICLPTTGSEVWVVSSQGNESQMHTGGSNESLLKRQLETGAGSSSKESTSPPATTDDSDNGDLERCPYCPFETTCAEYFKGHLKNHIAMSKQREEFSCEHCDYSVPDEAQLKDHVKIHFKSIDSNKSVAFYTSYDNLELNLVNEEGDNSGNNNNNSSLKNNNSKTSVLYKSDASVISSPNVVPNRKIVSNRRSVSSSRSNSTGSHHGGTNGGEQEQGHRTILVNTKTGQVISRK